MAPTYSEVAPVSSWALDFILELPVFRSTDFISQDSVPRLRPYAS